MFMRDCCHLPIQFLLHGHFKDVGTTFVDIEVKPSALYKNGLPLSKTYMSSLRLNRIRAIQMVILLLLLLLLLLLF